ncbi:MAG: tetratricopeptide repeat protein [Muribaculaceae bacterium]|nr:tetratricopeptide repeat protein [Muribaculaceae bacterium]
MKKTLLTLLLLATYAFASAEVNPLLEKARRAYANREWASATALYGVYCDREPGMPEAYARRVVASELIRDTISSVDAIQEALNAEIPPADLFSLLSTEAFAAGEPGVVPDVLERTRRRLPWMGRPIDTALLRYYSFRNNAPATERYARTLLAGLPDDPEYLTMLASSCMAQGKEQEALETYGRILEKNPDHFDTLVLLGTYWLEEGNKDKAREYLTRAGKVKSTPALRKMLSGLSR